LYGNRIDGSSAQEQDDVATANLGTAARAAARIGGTVLVEPVSGAPHYPLRTAADCLEVIDRVQADESVTNLGFLCDLYHLSVNGDDVLAVIAEHGHQIAHVQVADAPGRGEPGTGELDLDGALAALAVAGYTGWVGLEYTPSTADTAASLAWLPREARAS
jgi:hydroxypyruvate isomerase